MSKLADRRYLTQGGSGPLYTVWQGDPADYVIRAARGTRRDPKGEASEQPFLAVSRRRLPRLEQDLVAQGWTVLGPVRQVGLLSQDQQLALGACLSLTRKQQARSNPELGLGVGVEQELMALCPTWSVAGLELDLTKGLKDTIEGRSALNEALERLREHYDARGVAFRASWSASCEDEWCPDPDGPGCDHAVSGLHLEFGYAAADTARPDLGRIAFLEAKRVGQLLGLAPGVGEPGRPDHRGAWLDLSTLHADQKTRGKLLRALGAPHGRHGPKRLVQGPWVDPTPLASWWLAEAIEERETELAVQRRKEKLLAALPKREPRPPLLATAERTHQTYPETVAVLAEYRTAADRQGLTRALALILLQLGLDREAGIDLVQSALQRTERRTVEHVFEDTEQKLRAGERKLAGKGWVVRQNLYLLLVRLASALARDLGKDFVRVYQEVAKVFESAGSTRVQVRAEAVLTAVEEVHRRLQLEGEHRYATLLRNLMLCGQAHHELCPQTQRIKIGYCTCKVLFCDYCKAYQILRTADLARDMWKDKPISIAETREFPTLADLRRTMRKLLPPIGIRWVLGCRGPGRWYYLVLMNGVHAHLAAPLIQECVRTHLRLTPDAAAGMVAGAMLSVHAAAQDLFMRPNVVAWESFMDEVHGAHLTGAQRGKGALPWPKKGERLEAGEDYGEGEDECDALCRRYHEHSIVDPSGVVIVSKLEGHPPTLKSRRLLSQIAGVDTPSGRAKRARLDEIAPAPAAGGRIYRKRVGRPAPT